VADEQGDREQTYDPAEHKPDLEHFHDDYWTGPKLWVLGIITLGSALFVIWILSNTMTRPI